MILICLVIILLTLSFYWLRLLESKNRVCVLVLGDIGRSPRMQYHVLSLVKSGYVVDFTGYKQSNLGSEFRCLKEVNIHGLIGPPACFKNLPKILEYICKTMFLFVVLLFRLLIVKRPSHILVQNPPSIPTLLVVWITCKIRSCKFVIDWHNYGYTIMSLTLGTRHKLVRIARVFESYFAKKADFNLCVTNGMKEDLKNTWNVVAVTHYDRPPLKFQRTDVKIQHELFMKLCQKHDIFKARGSLLDSELERTSLTVKYKNGKVYLLPCRPALLVSSTSWTEDEDFSILLSSLEKYEAICEKTYKEKSNFKVIINLVCIITGKGPMKEHYLRIIKEKQYTHVKICTPWLESDDYPVLLGSCDLGICLHTSSSGLDLPMKVVDMFGCGLPVCAVCFKCLPELVKHNKNGMIFHCASELSQQIVELLEDFPDGCLKLKELRENVKDFQALRWHDSWMENVLPIFQKT